MNFLRKLKKKHIVVTALIAVYSLTLVHITQAVAASAEPGSDGDPIVAQSYVDEAVKGLNTKIDLLSKQQPGGKVEFVEVAAGKQILTGDNTQIILRTGKATAIASGENKIADLTGGKDLATGEAVTTNHLLMGFKNDGRGIKVTANAWVVVMGTYTLK